MRLKFATLIAALFVVAACATAMEEEATTGGEGGGSQAQAAAPVQQSQQEARETAPSVTPGSQQDLVANVGDRVFFEFDQYDLTANARRTLERQAAWLERFPDVDITVEGHADERGTREYNLALGDRRATAVKNFLVAQGIDPSRIRTISYGKERPVALGSNEVAWAQNRRGVTVVN